MVKFEDFIMPAASLGPVNPMPDIKNVSYIHAGYELTDKVTEEERTYIGHGMIPTLLPYLTQDGYDRDRKPRAFKAAVVENSRIKAIFLPELGGRLWSIFDKKENKELLYVNPVFQPGNLALRNAWFSGGVEFNVGIKGHNPLTCSNMWCAVDKTEKGDVLRIYEYERIRGVVYSISAYLPEESPVLYIKCRIENATEETKHMYWWSNIAVPETPETRVLVPADDSFLCFYNADHYVLDKASIPVYEDVDVSYPANIVAARDYFYKIPKDHYKWIATADKEGFGLLHCSTKEQIGRKLFVWGMNPGGRHWNEWLSVPNSNYIEIQAGLAHTQLEHIPMKGNTAWEWVEAYTALKGQPEVMHGDYKNAIDSIEDYMLERLGDPNKLTFPGQDEVISTEIVYRGSDWGAVEESIRGKRISDALTFPKQSDEETAEWTNLLENGTFPAPDVSKAPVSYVCGEFWREKLENLAQPNWYSLLHLGVVKYGMGDSEGAMKAWKESVAMTPSAWALRNIAMLYKNELGDLDTARAYILKAFEMMSDHPVLCKEVAMQLTADGNDEKWLEIYDKLPADLKARGRLRLYRAIACINLDRLEEAKEVINADFVMSDIKEGELSVSHYWFELYRRVYAKEQGKAYDPEDQELAKAADAKYPLPREIDFRMHD